MSRIAYVNGAYVPIPYAAVHIEDRGYQFADGVYEGVTVRHGRMVDLEPHLDRLWRSMGRQRLWHWLKAGLRRWVPLSASRHVRVTRLMC